MPGRDSIPPPGNPTIVIPPSDDNDDDDDDDDRAEKALTATAPPRMTNAAGIRTAQCRWECAIAVDDDERFSRGEYLGLHSFDDEAEIIP